MGGAIAPLLVAPIQAAYGWRASFWVFGFAGVAWPVLWSAWYRDHPAEKSGVSAEELAEAGGARSRSKPVCRGALRCAAAIFG